MTVKDPGRIPVGLFQGERLSDDGVRRLSVGASRIVAFAGEPDASTVRAQWSRVAPEIEVEVVPAVADVREAIIECAKRKVIWLAAPEPRNATRFVAGALQGAAAATEFEIPSVAVHVLRDQGIPGPVAWLTQTGAMSGYGVLYAVAIAAMSGRSVTMIAPTELRAPRTPEAVEVAERYIAESGVEVERLSDPSPLQRVLGGAFGAVVHPVLDAPGGKSLLRPGELPAKSVAQGNPAAVVELLEKFPGDVIAVFDGVQLVYGSGAAARIAAGVALGITAVAGLGAVAAPAALAAEPAPAAAPAAHHAGQATENKQGNVDHGAAWWKHDQGGSGSTDTQTPELPKPDQPKPDEPKPDAADPGGDASGGDAPGAGSGGDPAVAEAGSADPGGDASGGDAPGAGSGGDPAVAEAGSADPGGDASGGDAPGAGSGGDPAVAEAGCADPGGDASGGDAPGAGSGGDPAVAEAGSADPGGDASGGDAPGAGSGGDPAVAEAGSADPAIGAGRGFNPWCGHADPCGHGRNVNRPGRDGDRLDDGVCYVDAQHDRDWNPCRDGSLGHHAGRHAPGWDVPLGQRRTAPKARPRRRRPVGPASWRTPVPGRLA